MFRPRVVVFRSVARLRKILTIDNLRKRGHIIVNGCPLYLVDAESPNHLFIHCSFSMKVWVGILCRFGLCWVMPHLFSELFWQWRLYGVQPFRRCCGFYLCLLDVGRFGLREITIFLMPRDESFKGGGFYCLVSVDVG